MKPLKLIKATINFEIWSHRDEDMLVIFKRKRDQFGNYYLEEISLTADRIISEVIPLVKELCQ